MAASGVVSAPQIEVLSSKVEKPELDDRSYRLIRLQDNKLEALLVHDPKTDKASAAMDVHVGHLSDPKEFQGLAHALEHCLFLGILLLLHV
jgi:insulysin